MFLLRCETFGLQSKGAGLLRRISEVANQSKKPCPVRGHIMNVYKNTDFKGVSAEGSTASFATESGKSVIRQEAAALHQLADGLDGNFDAAVRILLHTEKRIIVTGIGKSGHIARKIAATLAATGSPAFFIHPAEASHGDLGMLMQGDSLLAFSNSGATPELSSILAHASRLSIPIISVASQMDSPLARQANVHLALPRLEEACPVRIAPTTSTTMMLALGDALAVAVMRLRGITRHDLALLHPGGNIGRRLMPVDQMVQPGVPLPLVYPRTKMRDVVLEMTSVGKGVAGVVDEAGHLIGIITDGDLRRSFDRIAITTAQDIMSKKPITIPSGTTLEDAYLLLNEAKITVAFVMARDEPHRPAGIIHIHDLALAV